MISADTDYFRDRAVAERKAARQARERYIGEIHMELARAYEALAKQPVRAGLRVVSG